MRPRTGGAARTKTRPPPAAAPSPGAARSTRPARVAAAGTHRRLDGAVPRSCPHQVTIVVRRPTRPPARLPGRSLPGSRDFRSRLAGRLRTHAHGARAVGNSWAPSCVPRGWCAAARGLVFRCVASRTGPRAHTPQGRGPLSGSHRQALMARCQPPGPTRGFCPRRAEALWKVVSGVGQSGCLFPLPTLG